MNFLLKILVTTFAVAITSYLLPGVSVDSFTTSILVALVLAVLNIVLKPVLIILTIPVTLLSFGLFLLVINAFIIIITSNIIDGFKVDGFWQAMFFSIILTVISSILERIGQQPIKGKKES